MSLQHLGWNPRLETEFATYRDQGLTAARVAREDRGRYLVIDADGEARAEVSGRLRHEAATRADLPAVGDWVALHPGGGDSPRVIAAVLPRAGAFTRKVPGETTEEQIVAANVDVALVVVGLDGDFNPRRIERYVAASWESGAEPVVVLNKLDVAEEPEALIAEAEGAAPGVAVVPVSAREGRGIEALGPWLGAGRTVALLGSSGVGKSTLANALLGEARQETQDVRAGDSRGRHTTTCRELIVLPGGALLIDSPGMRELQLWGGEESLAGAFPDVDALASRCRFRDCRHDTEPGCTVREAIEGGALDPGRFASWRKLQRELLWLAARQDQRLRAERSARWKAISRAMRSRPDPKRL